MLPKKHLGVKCSSSKSLPSTYRRGLVAPLHLLLSDIGCGKQEKWGRTVLSVSTVYKARFPAQSYYSICLVKTFRFPFQERGSRGYKVTKVSHPPGPSTRLLGLRTGAPLECGLQARAGHGEKTHINHQKRDESASGHHSGELAVKAEQGFQRALKHGNRITRIFRGASGEGRPTPKDNARATARP